MKSDLKRDLGLFAAIGVGLGAIIGAGIFVVTGVAAGIAGASFLISLLIAGLVAAFNALSSAQLAAAYPQSGGTYEYGYQVLHPMLGFAAGWMFLASKLAAGGTVALGFAGYLNALIPGIPQKAIAIFAVLLLAIINYFGIRKTGMLNTIIVSISLITLLIFVFSGLPTFSFSNFQPFAPGGKSGIFQAAALLFFAYTGYARLATLGEEVRKPRITIPKAIIVALSIAAILYAAVAAVAVGNIGAERMAASSSPIETAASSFIWPRVSWVVAIGATTAMLGVLLSQILGISRMVFAMARRQDFPPIFAHIHPKFSVPDFGIFMTAFFMLLVVIFGTLEIIVSAASFTILIYYSITNMAALKMQPENRLYPVWVPVLGLISCLALAFTLQTNIIVSGIGLIILGLILQWIFNRIFNNISDQPSNVVH